MEFRLFGPFSMSCLGAELAPPRSRKAQWLLALLVLRQGRPVERSFLAGTLWPESSESQALYNLRRELSVLRKALAGEARRVLTPSSVTLALDLQGAWADVLDFDQALASGEEESLARAVGLHQGPLLEGCTEEWVLGERMQRHRAYVGAVERLGSRALECGEPAAAVRYFRLAAEADPLSEREHRLLLESLAACGEYAAATQVYRELRRLLHQELNAEPSVETDALFRRIRREARQLGVRCSAFGLREGTSEVGVPSPKGQRPTPNAQRPTPPLPRPLTVLIDRERERDEVKSLLGRSRLVTLTGTGGVGKTRLATQVAEEVADDYAGGLCFVELAPLADGALVEHAVAVALNVPEVAGTALADTLAGAVQERDLLLVLDNCEHLIDPCARLASRLLRAAPDLRILATSRQPLGLTGESVFRVPSLPAANPRDLARAAGDPVEWLLTFDACRLFVERAQQAQPSFQLTARNVAAVAEICHRLDGIPLAIELAAARVRVLSVEQIAARLDDRFALLTGGDRCALPRQQTLQATIDWSYDLLTSAERALLSRLSVFSGSWTLAAAEAVASDCGLRIADCGSGDGGTSDVEPVAGASSIRNPQSAIRNEEVLDLLTQLVDRSLVQYEEPRPDETAGRYRMLQTVRLYAWRRLAEREESGSARDLHLDYAIHLSEAARPHLDRSAGRSWLVELDRFHDDFRAALGWALEQAPEQALRLATLLCDYWRLRGYFGEGRSWLEQALQRAPAAADCIRAEGLLAAGILARCQADYQTAKRFVEESLEVSRRAGIPAGTASALARLGSIARLQGDLETAEQCYEESIAFHRKVGDPANVATATNQCAQIAFARGSYARARALYEESLTIYEEQGSSGVAWTLNGLGLVAAAEDDLQTAVSCFERALRCYRELGSPWNSAFSLNALGYLARARGDLTQAETLLEESLALWRETEDRYGISWPLNGLGLIAMDTGDYCHSGDLLRQSLRLRQEIGSVDGISYSLTALGKLSWRATETPAGARRAARLLGAAAGMREASGSPVRLPLDHADYDRCVAAVRSALREEEFAAVWREGRSLPPDRAVALALDGHGLTSPLAVS